jgi:uncharacterized membrane protein YjgN (DUF898 family)
MNRLKFEGKGWDFFKIFFVDVLLVLVSLTLLYPKALIREMRYLTSQASLGGILFEFRGKVKTFFKGYLKTLLILLSAIVLLIALTIGLNALFKGFPNAAAYVFALVYVLFLFLLYPIILHGDLSYYTESITWRSVAFSWKGKLSELVPLSFQGSLLTILTLGIYTPWQEIRMNQYLLRNLRFGSLRFDYGGTSKPLFRIYLKGFLLGLVTLGIYYIWFFRDWYNYTVNNIVVRKGEQEFNLHAEANSLEVFELLIGNFLLTVFTLGFGLSWAYIRMMRFIVNHCIVPEAFNLDSIEDQPEEETEVPSNHWLDRWNPKLMF